MTLNGRLYRINNATWDLTGHWAISYYRHYIKFFKVYGDMAEDIVDVEFNPLELKGKLLRPLKFNPDKGYWR